MPKHKEKKQLPYPAAFVFELIWDVQKYPEFLPWCLSTRIVDYINEQGDFHADMVIGYRFFREKFRSEVTSSKPLEIDVKYIDGPFDYLQNHWKFTPISDHSCEVEFYVDFEFRSKFFQSLIQKVFTEAVHKMVLSFEKRAYDLYHKKT